LQWIPERGSVPLNWRTASTGLSLRDPAGSFYLLLLIAAATVPVAALRKQLSAAAILSGAAVLAVEHIRFEVLFAIVMVIVRADVLTSGLTALRGQVKCARLASALYGTLFALGAGFFAAALAGLRSADLVSDRSYLGSTDLGSFEAGLFWWFPEGRLTLSSAKTSPGKSSTLTTKVEISLGASVPNVSIESMGAPFRSARNWWNVVGSYWPLRLNHRNGSVRPSITTSTRASCHLGGIMDCISFRCCAGFVPATLDPRSTWMKWSRSSCDAGRRTRI
jgi:hypothetical protein